MNLLRNIVGGVWMLEKSSYLAAMPFVSALFAGKEVTWPEAKAVRPFAWYARNDAKYYDFSSAPNGSVAVHKITGMITKNDQVCGPDGTQSKMKQMANADRQPNIVAHLLEIDSGGGEATNIETVTRAIRALEKPVVAIVNGMAASAAYYIACAADEIYASEDTDMFGSIGVVLSFADVRPMLEKEGVKFHEVYASQSSLKNEDWRLAFDGQYEKVREKLLDPYAKAFIRTVQEFRPGLKDDKKVFKGETYMAQEAQAIGLIDGIMTWEQASQRAIELGTEKKRMGSRAAATGRASASNHNHNSTMTATKKHARISAVLGYELNVDAEGGAYLQEQELEAIERRVNGSAPTAPAVELVELTAVPDTAVTDALSGIAAQLGTITTEMGTIRQTLTDTGNRLSALEDRVPGASITLPKADSDPASTESDDNPLLAESRDNGVLAENWNNPFIGL